MWGAEILKGPPATWNRPMREHDLDDGVGDRIAFSEGHDLAPFGCTAVAVTPGWLRSEMVLENYRVSEQDWRDALQADPDRARWNQRSASWVELSREYGFTDVDGRRPDAWAEQ